VEGPVEGGASQASASGGHAPSESGDSNDSGSDDEQLVPLVPEAAARQRRQAAHQRKLSWWRALDEKWVKPTFGGSAESSSDAMPRGAGSSGGGNSSTGLPLRLARATHGAGGLPATGSGAGGSGGADGKKAGGGAAAGYSSLPSSANTHLRKQHAGGEPVGV
jgi:hypothetical protein